MRGGFRSMSNPPLGRHPRHFNLAIGSGIRRAVARCLSRPIFGSSGQHSHALATDNPPTRSCGKLDLCCSRAGMMEQDHGDLERGNWQGTEAHDRHARARRKGVPPLGRPADRQVDDNGRWRLDGRLLGRHALALRKGYRRGALSHAGRRFGARFEKSDRSRDGVQVVSVLFRRRAGLDLVRGEDRKGVGARRGSQLGIDV